MAVRLCPHFGICGGCSAQDLPYVEQLRNKESELRGLFIDVLDGRQVEPIEASPERYYYRNKMEFTFSRSKNNKKIICGLHSKIKKREVFALSECLLFSRDIGKIIRAVCSFADQKGFSFYSPFSHKGFLRYLVLRKTSASRELMVNLVTSSQEELNLTEFSRLMRGLNLDYKLKSLIWTVSDSLSDAVVPEDVKIIWGTGFIVEELKMFSCRIFPHSFFQINPYVLDGFYDFILNQTGLTKEDTVLDLFSGIGSISLLLSKSCKFIWAVEQNKEAVDCAAGNALLNGATNISFIKGDVRKVLYDNLYNWKDNVYLVVINPPRSGISLKVAERIKDLSPKKILYSSCNYKTLYRDSKHFYDRYKLVCLKPFDFFPHTPHFETLAIFTQKGLMA